MVRSGLVVVGRAHTSRTCSAAYAAPFGPASSHKFWKGGPLDRIPLSDLEARIGALVISESVTRIIG